MLKRPNEKNKNSKVVLCSRQLNPFGVFILVCEMYRPTEPTNLSVCSGFRVNIGVSAVMLGAVHGYITTNLILALFACL